MEEIYYEDGIYNVTSITEIREKLESSVTAVDLWFPHISKNIVIRWGQKDFITYTDSLLSTTRSNRAGFPEDVLIELGKIIDVHNTLYPQYKSLERIFI